MNPSSLSLIMTHFPGSEKRGGTGKTEGGGWIFDEEKPGAWNRKGTLTLSITGFCRAGDKKVTQSACPSQTSWTEAAHFLSHGGLVCVHEAVLPLAKLTILYFCMNSKTDDKSLAPC